MNTWCEWCRRKTKDEWTQCAGCGAPIVNPYCDLDLPEERRVVYLGTTPEAGGLPSTAFGMGVYHG